MLEASRCTCDLWRSQSAGWWRQWTPWRAAHSLLMPAGRWGKVSNPSQCSLTCTVTWHHAAIQPASVTGLTYPNPSGSKVRRQMHQKWIYPGGSGAWQRGYPQGALLATSNLLASGRKSLQWAALCSRISCRPMEYQKRCPVATGPLGRISSPMVCFGRKSSTRPFIQASVVASKFRVGRGHLPYQRACTRMRCSQRTNLLDPGEHQARFWLPHCMSPRCARCVRTRARGWEELSA